MEQAAFDHLIGRLDNVLSELLLEAARLDLTPANIQTLRHHADDMIGAGKKMLLLLEEGVTKRST